MGCKNVRCFILLFTNYLWKGLLFRYLIIGLLLILMEFLLIFIISQSNHILTEGVDFIFTKYILPILSVIFASSNLVRM